MPCWPACRGTPRAIPAKFLYDARGSALFDEICELPEYYLTRTETEILQQRAGEIGRRAGPGCALVEFGSGSSVKSRLLIEAMRELAALRADRHLARASRRHGGAAAARLSGAEGRAGLRRLHGARSPADRHERGAAALGFFPGLDHRQPRARGSRRRSCSVRGGCWATAARWCWASISRRIRSACTTPTTIRRASRRPFTLNLLRRMNRELHADVRPGGVRARGVLQSGRGPHRDLFPQPARAAVTVAGRRFDFAEGERVHTEYSYKYDDRRHRRAGAQRRLPHRRDLDRSGAAVRRRLSGSDPLEAGSPPPSILGAGYRPGGEGGIAERGQGDTDTRPMRLNDAGPTSCRPTEKLIQRLSLDSSDSCAWSLALSSDEGRRRDRATSCAASRMWPAGRSAAASSFRKAAISARLAKPM